MVSDMAYPAIAVANEFIRAAKGEPLSPMKLQKLVYYAHGWYLALHDAPLIEEHVEAWQFGPVVPELYRQLKRYSDVEITRPARQWRGGSKFYEPRIENEDDISSRKALDVIQSVWSAYGDYSATKLSNATHKPGTPWSKTYDQGCRSTVIPDELIKDYFKAL